MNVTEPSAPPTEFYQNVQINFSNGKVGVYAGPFLVTPADAEAGGIRIEHMEFSGPIPMPQRMMDLVDETKRTMGFVVPDSGPELKN
jgi:hypothetical protein